MDGQLPGLCCPYCSDSFKRKEHLDRHLRRHSGSKPFQCKYCAKSFSRRYVQHPAYQTAMERLLAQNSNGSWQRHAGTAPVYARRGERRQDCGIVRTTTPPAEGSGLSTMCQIQATLLWGHPLCTL